MAEKQGKVTIYDVAALAGVSVSSVSRVLHNAPNLRADVRQRVEAAIRALDYVPNRTAQMLKTHRSYMLVHIVADVMQPFYITLHRRLRLEAEKRGYQVILFDADKDGPRVQRFIQLNGDRADGLICSARSVHEKLLEVFAECGIPVVFTNNCNQNLFDAIYPNSHQGTQLCMEHLLEMGHRRIAFVGSEEKDAFNEGRYEAYCRMLEEAGIEVEEALVRRVDEKMDGGYRAGISLAGLENPPTAVCTSGDVLAAGVIQAMHDLKIDVPGQVSVTGENDLMLGREMSPSLTTATDPAEAISATVIDYLLDRVEGRYAGPARIVETSGRELIKRDSTGRAK